MGGNGSRHVRRWERRHGNQSVRLTNKDTVLEAATSVISEHTIIELIIGKVPYWLRSLVGNFFTKGYA